MIIENHKEEVPFSHYAELFAQADTGEISQRLGIPFENGAFKLTLLGNTYTVTHPQATVGGGDLDAPQTRIFGESGTSGGRPLRG